MQHKPVIAITMGDPCGIGPEIIVKALSEPSVIAGCVPLVVGDLAALERAQLVAGTRLHFRVTSEAEERISQPAEGILLLQVSELTEDQMIFGNPGKLSGDAVYNYITTAVRLCKSGLADALATAPINKDALNQAGHHYPGHTELLAELTGTKSVVMMLAGSKLKVALVTIHEALTAVPSLLTISRVLDTIRITAADLRRYQRPEPRIAVLSLNPHGGENGLFGDEEAKIIAPAIQLAADEGINATGPYSADTLFHFAVQGAYDAVVCMYHDQGLIPLKLMHFDDGVNITLGLPIIRTSVDHGTAYNLAGTGKASANSMIAAIKTATEMARVKRASVAR